MATLEQTNKNLGTTSERLAKLADETVNLIDKIDQLNNRTKHSIFKNGVPADIGSFDKELDKLDKLNEKLSSLGDDIDLKSLEGLEKEYSNINGELLTMKQNEIAASNQLKSYITYAKDLKRFMSDIVKSMTESNRASKNIGEYFDFNDKTLKPYGIKVRKATEQDNNLLDNENRVRFDDNILELDTDKLKQVGSEYEQAIKEFIGFLVEFKQLNKELGSTSALNRVSPREILSASGEIRPEYRDKLAIGTRDDLKPGMSTFTPGVDVAEVSYKAGGETARAVIKQLVTDGLKEGNLYDRTSQERLNGFTDEKGEHLGYKSLVSKEEELVTKLTDSLGKISNFIPGLASDDIKQSLLASSAAFSGGAGFEGTDLAKRMSFSSYAENIAEDVDTNIKDVPITAIKSFKELGQTTEEVRGKLEELGKGLPKTKYTDEYDALANRRLGDLDSIDRYGKSGGSLSRLDDEARYTAPQYTADIRDDMSEAEKSAAQLAADIKNSISEQITKTGLLSSIVDDSEERAVDQYKFKNNFRSSAASNKGAADYWGQAKDQVEKIDSLQGDVEKQFGIIEDIFKSGNIQKLLEKDEWNNKGPIEELNSLLADMMKQVQAFDKGSFAESATTPDKEGKVLFNKDKYIEFANKISDSLNSLLENSNFENFGTSDKELETLAKTAEEVKAKVSNSRNSEISDKLNNELLKNLVNEQMLSSEVTGRESNVNSGLLAGKDLTDAQNRLEQVRVELQSVKDNIVQINEEAEKSGINTDSAVKKAEVLNSLYASVSKELGSAAKADKFFDSVKSLTQLTDETVGSKISGEFENLSRLDLSQLVDDLKLVKNDLGLLNGGRYEKGLLGQIQGSKGLSKSEQEIAKYSNDAIKEQLNNARIAMTGSYDSLEDVASNIGAEDLKAGIDKIKESIANTEKKLQDLGDSDTTGEMAKSLISFKDKLRNINTNFESLEGSLTDNSGIGQLRAVFESSKPLANSLTTLNEQVDLAVKTVKKNRELEESGDNQKKLQNVKNYVSNQEALTNTKMPYAEQYKYYDKQLANFKEGTDEYIEVLKLRNQAENKAKEQSRKAAEDFDKIIEDVNRSELEAVNAAKSRVNSILSTVKSLADGINSAVNKIVQIIRSGISIINKIISSATRFIVTIGQGVRGIIALFGNLGNRVRQSLTGVESSGSKVTNTFNLIAGSATELRSKILILKGGFDSLFNNGLVKRAKNLMASVYSLKNIAGTKTTQDVIDWANSMEYAFGLSAKGLIGDINELTGVLYGLGMSAKDTAVGSENILMMSRYLSFMGAAGGDASAVMEKLVSGMKGMTQAIDDLGLSVRDSQMDEFLKNLKKQGGEFAGIATDFSSLNEQARVYVRYASLIDQFTRKYDITNFTTALHSEIGSLQILSERVSSLLDTLGTGITKLLSKLAVYIIPVVSLVERLITKLFLLIGIDTNLNTNLNGSTEALDDVSSGLDDTKNKLDEVSESAKKAGGNLQSFDRINNVTSSSKSGASGDANFDYSKLMNSALDKLNKMAKEATVSYTDGLLAEFKNKLKQIKDELIQFSKDITGRNDFNLGFDWKKINNNLKTIYNNIIYTLKRWGKFVIEISLKVIDDLNIGIIITKLTELLAVISQVVTTITIALIPAFREFYDIALSPIVKYIGEQFVKAIDFTIQELNKWGYWFIENKENIIKFFRDLAEIVNAAWEVVRPFLDLGWEKLGSLISNFGDKLRESLNGLMADTGNEKSGTIAWIQTELPGIIDGAITKVKELWGALNGDVSEETEGTTWGEFLQILANLHDIIIALQPIISQLLSDLSAAMQEDVLPWLNDELSKLGDWLTDNKDAIINIIEKITSATWEGFTAFVDALGKLVDYVVNNPDSVIHFFEGLIGLKVASWCVSTAAGIGTLITGLQGLSGFSSLLGGLTGGGAAAGAAGAGAAGAGGAAAGGGLLGGLSAGPILAVVAAIVALGLAIKDLWNTSKDFRDNIKGVWDDITGAFSTAKTKISGTFSGLKEAFGQLYEAYDNSGLKKLIEGIVTLVVYVFGGAITNLLTLLGQLLTTVINLITDVINLLSGLWKFAEGIKKVIIGIFTLDPDKILEGIGLIVDGFILALQGLLNGINDLFGGIITLVLQLGSDLVGGLLDGIVGAWDNLVQGTKKLIDDFINLVKGFLGLDDKSEGKTFKDIGQGIIDSIKSGILGAWNTFSDWISKKFEGLVTKVSDILGGIKDKVKNIFKDSNDDADTEVKGLDERLTDKSNTIKRTFTVGKNTFTSTTKANTARRVTGRAGTISRHANGGSIAGGQLFIANENGGAELIGNIDGTGKTNVANNNMIIQAMSSGIFEAVYNAMAEVLNQRNNTGNTGNTTIRLDGFGLIDANTLRELARILAPYLKSNDINIADTQFSI